MACCLQHVGKTGGYAGNNMHTRSRAVHKSGPALRARSELIPLMPLTEGEREALAAALALPTDFLRQSALGLLDAELRARLDISPRKYYTIVDGAVYIDTKRERIPPVRKISKSDLTPAVWESIQKLTAHLKDL